eukprot:CAMPEP_0115699580 /NCGR_PEP_ID=MMETSP0272-20121206/66954_1 /TAXON_ID=71861 /ORGANISM="Scrippsiella trochoidea, Strain CCMP3099" /LENGTH=140 /DNA_ID=CAMNT_0003140013 /DNA_START=1240 /DNA_END=1662 /DNA_ORIENTATION=+
MKFMVREIRSRTCDSDKVPAPPNHLALKSPVLSARNSVMTIDIHSFACRSLIATATSMPSPPPSPTSSNSVPGPVEIAKSSPFAGNTRKKKQMRCTASHTVYGTNACSPKEDLLAEICCKSNARTGGIGDATAPADCAPR